MNIETVSTFVILLGYFLAHAIPFLPVSVSTKIPNAIMRVINILAAKHNLERLNQTDINGNPTEVKKDV